MTLDLLIAPGCPRLGRRRRLSSLAALGFCAALVWLSPSAAAAAIPDALRPGTRPFSILIGVGPSFGLRRTPCYEGSYYGGAFYGSPGPWGLGCGGALTLSQTFAAHFSGNASGPSLGLVVQEEVLGSGYFGMAVLPRFAWDIQVHKRLGLYISPNVALGYHLAVWRGFAPSHGADIQGGVMTSLLIHDRVSIWAQLPHFDFVFAPGYFIPRYDLMVGAGVAF